jgi:CRISPR-associated protein Cas2
MFVVVSYDIPNDKRRTRVMKTLKDFGNHTQYSVFECDIKEPVYRRMRERLKRYIVEKDDSVRFYFLDEDAVKKIEAIGTPGVRRAREWEIIG